MTTPTFMNRSLPAPGLVSPNVSWDTFWEDYLGWANGTVLRAQTPDSMVHKFREESQEFLDEPSVDEAIDCIAVLMFWADHMCGMQHHAGTFWLDCPVASRWTLVRPTASAPSSAEPLPPAPSGTT